MLALIPLIAVAQNNPPKEFYDYLNAPDAAYKYEVQKVDNGTTTINLTSQKWHDLTWKHTLLYREPSKAKYKGLAVLYITGDGPRPGDWQSFGLMTEATGMPVAMLFDIPNQPLFGGMKEDQIISYTFAQYFKTQDATWPLLFPMAKAALRAMDAVVESTKNTANPITKFVVTGASKRGWTTWFVGASKDKRVIGIAPMVIDNLNVVKQMPHQLAMWGKYSEQIEDYTKRGLQAQLATPAGQKLGAMIDPYSYRKNITMPTLIVKGSNDPYWTVDALDLYFKDLKQPKWVLNVPNAGHGLNGGLMAIQSIGAFARSLAGEFSMPKYKVDLSKDGNNVSVKNPKAEIAPIHTILWFAESSNLDFRGSKYFKAKEIDGLSTVTAPLTAGLNTAAFVELRFRVNGREFSLSTPTKVFRK